MYLKMCSIDVAATLLVCKASTTDCLSCDRVLLFLSFDAVNIWSGLRVLSENAVIAVLIRITCAGNRALIRTVELQSNQFLSASLWERGCISRRGHIGEGSNCWTRNRYNVSVVTSMNLLSAQMTMPFRFTIFTDHRLHWVGPIEHVIRRYSSQLRWT